ncbi:hypothetical protein OJF2_17980 [Aquisphaera giovannonii]|uniref:DUF1559 domain-containing protein n=1 Tax=Aquisphaera giovannonii TaxID=406548 RepID=A0A5B9VZA5_9BACT|nr:DUF1559 domain-containing protein [Aquisphaera giovannonii]QEH33297.1 hypothetical protein OJF2_17980 [Aquisphaera giovannonii]
MNAEPRPAESPPQPADVPSPAIRRGRPFRLRPWHLVFPIAAVAGLFSLARYFERQRVRHEAIFAAQAGCQENLNALASAMAEYAKTFGHLPPPFQPDPDGKRRESWRATFLPRFGAAAAVGERYDFRKSWDSDENQHHAGDMPALYGCPAYRSVMPEGNASYRMINDLSAIDPAKLPRNAILLIESAGLPLDWRSPFDELSEEQVRSIASPHPSGFGVVLADFTSVRLKDVDRIRTVDGLYVLDEPKSVNP